jgi:hypothetical protein
MIHDHCQFPLIMVRDIGFIKCNFIRNKLVSICSWIFNLSTIYLFQILEAKKRSIKKADCCRLLQFIVEYF